MKLYELLKSAPMVNSIFKKLQICGKSRYHCFLLLFADSKSASCLRSSMASVKED